MGQTTEATPAEQRAERQGLPVVRMTPFEYLRVASGHPMIAGTVDGGEVLLRLATVEELSVYMPRSEAERLAKPLDLP